MCTKKGNIGTELKQNNDWGHKAFFLLRCIDFFFFRPRNPFHVCDTCPVSSLKQPRTTIPPEVLCFLSQQRLWPRPPCSLIITRLVLFFIYFYYSSEEAKSQVQFFWRRVFAGEQNCSLFYCFPSVLEGVTAIPPLVSRRRLSVHASLIWDAKESAAKGDSEGGRRDVRRRISGCVSMKDDLRIVTSTDGKRGDVSFLVLPTSLLEKPKKE